MTAFRAFTKACLLLCLLILSLEHSAAQVDLDRGLIGYWPLDSSTTNESLNRLPGTDLTLVGSPTYAYGYNGVQDEYGALYFNGESCAKLNSSLPTSLLTLSLKFNTNNSTGGILAGSAEYGYGIGLNEWGRLYAYVHTSRTDRLDFILEGANLADGQWHHTAITFDDTTFKVFLDGRLVYTGPSSSSPQSIYFGSNDSLFLGALPSLKQAQMYSGKIDEILLYNRAIGGREVQLLAQSAVPTWDKDLETGLLVHLPMSEGEVNHSPNHTNSITIKANGGVSAKSCRPGEEGMKFFTGETDHVALKGMLHLIDAFSLSITFSTSDARESIIAGWEKGGYQVIFSPQGAPGKLLVRIWMTDGDSVEFLSPQKVNDGRCHTVVLTVDSQAIRAYLDGQLIPGGQNEGRNSRGVHYSSDLLWIGNLQDSTGWSGFQGKLSEFRLYNRSLTKDEVTRLSLPIAVPVDLAVRKYNLGGSRRNDIPPRGCVVLMYNPSAVQNYRATLTPEDDSEDTRKVRLKPQGQEIEEFAGVPSDRVKINKD